MKRLAHSLCFLCLFLSCFLVYQVMSRSGVNHVAFDIRSLFVIAGLAVIVGWTRLAHFHGRATLVAALLLATQIGVLDHFNMLVEHGRWCERGMPGFGQIEAPP